MQLKFGLSYILLIAAVLVLLNTYPLIVSEDLVFRSKATTMQACRWNPAVPVGAISVIAYLLTQTIWRLRGRCGWVLRYNDYWLWAFLLLMAVNCLVRNLLWFGLGIAL